MILRAACGRPFFVFCLKFRFCARVSFQILSELTPWPFFRRSGNAITGRKRRICLIYFRRVKRPGQRCLKYAGYQAPVIKLNAWKRAMKCALADLTRVWQSHAGHDCYLGVWLSSNRQWSINKNSCTYTFGWPRIQIATIVRTSSVH